jgi:hypothetical protein
MLNVAAGFVERNVLDPNVGVDRFLRLPARNCRDAGVVGGQSQIELAAVTIQ